MGGNEYNPRGWICAVQAETVAPDRYPFNPKDRSNCLRTRIFARTAGFTFDCDYSAVCLIGLFEFGAEERGGTGTTDTSVCLRIN